MTMEYFLGEYTFLGVIDDNVSNETNENTDESA